ncbi:oxidoreductase [Calidifontibacter sp. DB0510]|uniref:Oxidoreductase n=1 Tax=Metallococcus carri TaxID=1656884 RepID=A0A967AZ93_9MICO|nr:oxidoreductase [Metallococcus carri]NHN55104.1 oxidoreductase [Metallococcus carri]NOP36181.1 oxidoreductase [Calidifontibacter sp. DB2511S]
MTSDTFPLAGHQVRRMGFGAMQLPGPGVFGPPRDHDEAIAVLKRAIALGVNHIDTSQFYGPDVANALIREALAPYPDDLVLVSKVGARRDDQAGWLPAQAPETLKADVRRNLEALGVDRLPVVNLRVMPADEIPAEEVYPFADQLAAMRELVDEGALEAFGVSNVSTEQAATALDAGAVCVQNAYNLLMRDDEPTLRLCAERGVAYVPFFPLGSAFPGMPKVTEDDTVARVAADRGCTPAQVGLAWLLQRSDNILLIPGTSSVTHLEENIAAAELTLTDEELDALGR